MNVVSATEADWSREFKRTFQWIPGKALLATLRRYQRVKRRRHIFVLTSTYLAYLVVKHRFWSAVSGAEIPLNCDIGGGLMIPHPNGIVIHPGAIIGPNCLILQQVTIGAMHGIAPKIGGHVDIGAGAKILGEVDRKSTRLNSSHVSQSRMPSSA